jgi:hypothetical protein
MSGAEMTVDPLFTFNGDLAPVSNIHTAERVIECAPSYEVSEAPWRILLPQGGVIRGVNSQVGSWPTALADQAPNRRIVRQGASGQGKVLEDRSGEIQSALTAYNETVPTPAVSSSGGCTASGTRGQNGALFGALAAVTLLSLRKRRSRSSVEF